MFRTITIFSFLFLFAFSLFGQPSRCKLNLRKGQEIIVQVEAVNNKIQTAGAQIINFKLSGSAIHKYTVTNITSERIELDHELQSIIFEFDGMGQKKKFNSSNEDDFKGPFGPYIKYLLGKHFYFGIDSAGGMRGTSFSGNWMMSFPTPDEKIVTIIDMLEPLTEITESSVSSPAFFRSFPASRGVNDSLWMEGLKTESEDMSFETKIAQITDSTIIVTLKTTATCNSAAEKMGRHTKTNENIVSTGQLIYDRKTCLVKEKTITSESNGTTEVMGGKVPINGRVNITMRITPGK